MPYLQTDEDDEAVSDLEDQLRLYRMFVDAAEQLETMYKSSSVLFKRPFVKIKPKVKSGFVAPQNVDTATLRDSFNWILKKLEPFFALQEASIERIKSVEERIGELKGAITSRASMKFADVIKSAKSKPEVVVSFLALLELVRRQLVKANQKKNSEIIIEKI